MDALLRQLNRAGCPMGIRAERIQENELGSWLLTLVQEAPSYEGWRTFQHPDGAEMLARITDVLAAVPDAAQGEFDIMNIYKSDLFRYMTGDMVRDTPVTLIVRDVRMEKMEGGGKKEDKPVVYFEKTNKGAILNKTNAKALAADFGPETDDWRGRRVKLFAEQGTWFGVTGYALRMMPVAEPNGSRAPVEVDEIPFDVPDMEPEPEQA